MDYPLSIQPMCGAAVNAAGEEAATDGQGEKTPPQDQPPPRWIGPGLRGIEPDFDDIGGRARIRTVTISVIAAAVVLVVAGAIIWYVAAR